MSTHYFLWQLIDIEYMPEFPIKGNSTFVPRSIKRRDAFMKIMESDSSDANVHAVFINYCEVGGWAFLGNLCKERPIAFICMGHSYTPHSLSKIVTHEIGHVMGN